MRGPIGAIKCPKCGQEAAADASPEALAEKFYKQRWDGYYTCRNCTRRFSVRGPVLTS